MVEVLVEVEVGVGVVVVAAKISAIGVTNKDNIIKNGINLLITVLYICIINFESYVWVAQVSVKT